MGHLVSFIPRWQVVRARLVSCEGQLQPDWRTRNYWGQSHGDILSLFHPFPPSVVKAFLVFIFNLEKKS